MSPIGKGESLSDYVARCVGIVKASGLPFKLCPMGTCLEGEWDEVFGVIRQCFDALKKDCPRISIKIWVDYRKGAKGRLEGKVQSVLMKLKEG